MPWDQAFWTETIKRDPIQSVYMAAWIIECCAVVARRMAGCPHQPGCGCPPSAPPRPRPPGRPNGNCPRPKYHRLAQHPLSSISPNHLLVNPDLLHPAGSRSPWV